MSAIAPRAVRRFGDEAATPIDRLLSLAIVGALGVLVVALAATIGGAWSYGRDDLAAFAALSASSKADTLARTIAFERFGHRKVDVFERQALASALDDPALRPALSRAGASGLARLVASERDAEPQAKIARELSAFEGTLANVRSEIADASVARAAARAREAFLSAIAIAVAFAIVIACASIRFRRMRVEADRFSGMLERMLADMARSTIDRHETKRAEMVAEKARGRFVMSVDFRYVVTRPVSEELCEIFDIDDLEGYPFGTLLRRIAPNHDRAALSGFAERLFDSAFSDASLATHPLHEIRYGERTLAFEFERIWDRDEIEGIVVAVRDITAHQSSPDTFAASDYRSARQAAFDAFVGSTARPLVDALVDEIVDYSHVLGRTLRSNDIVRQLGKLHEATTVLLQRLVGLEFTYLATRVASFDARTTEVLGRPYGAGSDDLAYALAIAELTAELEAFRAVVPRMPKPVSS